MRLGERELSKLRWRCRRGLLENDLFIERYFNRHAATLTVRQALGMTTLMVWPTTTCSICSWPESNLKATRTLLRSMSFWR